MEGLRELMEFFKEYGDMLAEGCFAIFILSVMGAFVILLYQIVLGV